MGELSWDIPASAAFKLYAQEDTITVDALKEAASGISSSSDRGGGGDQAYRRLSPTHGHNTDCKLDWVLYAGVCM